MKSTRLIIIIRHELGPDRHIPAYKIKLCQNMWNTFHKRFTVDGAGIKVLYIKANLIFGLTNDRGNPSL